MNAKQELIKLVGKENAERYIAMVKEGLSDKTMKRSEPVVTK